MVSFTTGSNNSTGNGSFTSFAVRIVSQGVASFPVTHFSNLCLWWSTGRSLNATGPLLCRCRFFGSPTTVLSQPLGRPRQTLLTGQATSVPRALCGDGGRGLCGDGGKVVAKGLCGDGGVVAKVLWGDVGVVAMGLSGDRGAVAMGLSGGRGVVAIGLRVSCSAGTRGLGGDGGVVDKVLPGGPTNIQK